MKKGLLLLVIVCLSKVSFAGDNCMLYPISLVERVTASSLIVEGKVVAQHAFWNEQHTMIYTSNTVEVLQVFKGDATSQIDIITEGGTIDNSRIEHSATLQLSVNLYGIFFCQSSKLFPHSFSVFSSLQGFIYYNLKEQNAADPFQIYNTIFEARNDIENFTQQTAITIQQDEILDNAIQVEPLQKTTTSIAVKSFSPTIISGGTNSYLMIKGFGFGNEKNTGTVAFANANDGGQTYVQPTNPHYLFWNDTMIVIRMPSTGVNANGCAGTGNIKVTNDSNYTATSNTQLTVNYTYSNFDYKSFPYRADLVNLNGIGGYSFQLNNSFQQNSQAVAAINRAIDSWCTTNMNWGITANTTSVNSIAQDETSVIRFDEGNELPAGLLGKLVSYYTGKGQAGQAYDWYVSEMDMVFDDAVNWNFDETTIAVNQYDFQSVATHELGHGIQLNHVINSSDLMHYAMNKGEFKHQPSYDDIAGAQYIIHQSQTTNANGPQPMRPKACSLPISLISFSGIVDAANKVALKWDVDDEFGLQRYELTRSVDKLHFIVIDTIQALNMSELNTYTTSDSLIEDTVYYRLNLLSKDSNIYYSSTILVNKTDHNNSLIIYPNPATTDIILSTRASLIEEAIFTIYASDGSMMLQQEFDGNSNLEDIRISVYQLSPGFYFYEAKVNGAVYHGKLSKE